jgi:hypothetical protein
MGKGDPEGGRPRKEIDFKQLETMAQIQCTEEECAAIFDMDRDTLRARIQEETGAGFSAFYKKHVTEGKRSLRRAQYRTAIGTPADLSTGQAAIAGNPTMQIWLGKQMLGQEDKVTHQMQNPDGSGLSYHVVVPGVFEHKPQPDPRQAHKLNGE